MNLSPAVVRIRPVWKRLERRFPPSLIRPRPVFAAHPVLSAGLTRPLELPGELPEAVPYGASWPADDSDLVPAGRSGESDGD